MESLFHVKSAMLFPSMDFKFVRMVLVRTVNARRHPVRPDLVVVVEVPLGKVAEDPSELSLGFLSELPKQFSVVAVVVNS
jgi:hypothetical protein